MTEPENTATAELRAVDEALECGAATSADPLEHELQELALALRAERPEASPEFAAALRERVGHGFPRERRLPWRPRAAGFWRRLASQRRPPMAVVGGVASVLVAIAVVVSLTGDDEPVVSLKGDDQPDRTAVLERPPATDGLARPEARTGAGGTSAEALRSPGLSPPVPPGGLAPGARERRIERSAALTLAAPEDRLDPVADGIVRLTDRHRGFVLRSSVSSGDEGTTGGDFELRIPADKLQDALADLSKLADVRSRSQSGEDVTPQFVSAEERLEGARAERRSLLRRLERAPSDAAAESIRRRLDLNAGEIRGLRGRVRDLRTRTSYATVSVTLQVEDGEEGTSGPERRDGLGAAVDDALDSLSDSVEIAIRVIGVTLPLGLLGAVAVLGARAVRRRRREAALG